MKRLIIILAVALAVGWLLVGMVRDLADAIQYFSAQPHQLLSVAGIALVGGFAALVFDRLPARTQRQVRAFAWGAAASTLSGFIVYFAYRLASISSFMVEFGGVHWMLGLLLVLLLFSGIAVYLWFAWYRALKTGGSEEPDGQFR